MPRERRFERYGAEQQTFDLIGRTFRLYGIVIPSIHHEMHSYSDAIGEYELQERKVEYDGTLDLTIQQ